MSIAIIGAGLLGTSTALELADRGYRVVVFERNASPLAEASRHNEGKLHLGFVYAADASFRTARRMIHGVARFMDVLGRWIPGAELRALPARSFDYVAHRDTMVTVAEIEAHFARVSQTLVDVLPRKPTIAPLDVSRPAWRRLRAEEVASRYDPDIIAAGYETCEIAVDTWAISDHLCAALRAHPRIEVVTRARVICAEDRRDGAFDVSFDTEGPRRSGPFAAVVNASWANRPALDRRYGLPPRGKWINRRKLGVNFLCATPPDSVPSFTVMLGPFGDVVAYRSGRVYLSWYPACMIGTTMAADETDWAAVLRDVDTGAVLRETIDALARICPALGALEALAAGKVVVNGGSIFALGETDIDDRASQLHERFDVGIDAQGGYFSVDPAKFTLAPAIAIETADRVSSVVAVRS
jgi:glycine/D-amino acid oxidase-like deaminating enzyme